MSSLATREVFLTETPVAVPTPQNFALREASVAEPGPGELLCATEYLSLDPYMRGQLSGRHISGSVKPGETLRGESVSRVLQSRAEGFPEGSLVRGFGGWRSHAVLAASEVERLPRDHPQPSLALSSLGMPGLTAWAGIEQQARPRAGETVLISAATGAVGSVAAQLAAERGCRVVGIAGSAEKCRMACEDLGYAHCINRHQGKLADALLEHCPNGVDVYFDLVGGEMLNTVSEHLAVGARVVLCGLMADYNSDERTPGPYPGLWIRARAQVFGLVVYDFENQRQAFLEHAMPMVRAGRLRIREDIAIGLEAAPEAFCRLMRGENLGKSLVHLPQGHAQ